MKKRFIYSDQRLPLFKSQSDAKGEQDCRRIKLRSKLNSPRKFSLRNLIKREYRSWTRENHSLNPCTLWQRKRDKSAAKAGGTWTRCLGHLTQETKAAEKTLRQWWGLQEPHRFSTRFLPEDSYPKRRKSSRGCLQELVDRLRPSMVATLRDTWSTCTQVQTTAPDRTTSNRLASNRCLWPNKIFWSLLISHRLLILQRRSTTLPESSPNMSPKKKSSTSNRSHTITRTQQWEAVQ